MTYGSAKFGSKLAIFVIFPPQGLAQSSVCTLNHLQHCGFSPVVIFNAPLIPEDLAQLTPILALIIELANFGYDFAAYRDGLRVVIAKGSTIKRLSFLKDGTWFPITSNDTTLYRREQSDCDMIGHIYKTEVFDDHGREHVESHLLMFSEKAVEHPAFLRFWQKYVMSNSKVKTIKNGEKRLSQCMMSAGLRVDGSFSKDSLVALLRL